MRIAQFAVFFLVTQGIALAVHGYLASRLGVLGMPRIAAWSLLGPLWLAMLAALILSHSPVSHPMAKLLIWIGFAWMGSAFVLLVTGLLGQLAAAIATRAGTLAAQPLSAAIALAGGLITCCWALFSALRAPEIHRVDIRISGLPPEFEGYRIAHITDTHISHMLSARWTRSLVERVNAERPDLVVHTGDLVDGPVSSLAASVAPLGDLVGPKYFVTGNHEAYSGMPAWTAEVRQLGFRVLDNESVDLYKDGARIALAGVTDYNEGRFFPSHASDPQKALGHASPGVRILLAHQPRTALDAQQLGVSLQLSGHTHGGQIWPFHYLVRLQQPMNAGLALVGKVQVFTSRGAGFWGPPLRLFAPSEVPILVLHRD